VDLSLVEVGSCYKKNEPNICTIHNKEHETWSSFWWAMLMCVRVILRYSMWFQVMDVQTDYIYKIWVILEYWTVDSCFSLNSGLLGAIYPWIPRDYPNMVWAFLVPESKISNSRCLSADMITQMENSLLWNFVACTKLLKILHKITFRLYV
jgi:hypothetical protein